MQNQPHFSGNCFDAQARLASPCNSLWTRWGSRVRVPGLQEGGFVGDVGRVPSPGGGCPGQMRIAAHRQNLSGAKRTRGRGVSSAMLIVTSALKARPSSFRSGTEWHLYPTALQWRGRQRDAMPLRWTLAGPGASVAINMALQKELLASSQLLAAV